MNIGCICWRSKKQRTVLLSSTEGEHMSLLEATEEAVWLKFVLRESGEMTVVTQGAYDKPIQEIFRTSDQRASSGNCR